MNPQRIARLQEHGLTEYEARAYLALLELEKAEASQVADLSRVPRTKIYQALDGLESKKLIKVIPERPKRCLVQPFSNYLDELEASLRLKADHLSESREALEQEFAPRGNVQLENVGGFIVLKGRANIASKLAEVSTRAEREVAVATSEMGARRFAYHADSLRERAESGVAVRILAAVGPRNVEHLAPLLPAAEIRHALVDLGAVTLAFVDDAEALLVHHVPDDHHYFQGSDVALWTDDPAMVSSLKALFGLAWNLALPWDGSPSAPAGETPAANAVLAAVAQHVRATVATVTA